MSKIEEKSCSTTLPNKRERAIFLELINYVHSFFIFEDSGLIPNGEKLSSVKIFCGATHLCTHAAIKWGGVGSALHSFYRVLNLWKNFFNNPICYVLYVCVILTFTDARTRGPKGPSINDVTHLRGGGISQKVLLIHKPI